MRIDEIDSLYERSHIIGFLMVALFLIASLPIAINKAINNPVTYIFALLMIAGLMAVRSNLLYFHSNDYNIYLSSWVAVLRTMSVRNALATQVGNYNMPYMYILTIISRFYFPDLFLIKFVSMLFDILLAFFVIKLVSLRTDSINIKLAAYIGGLAIPTVILNSSMWAQCDSIYSAFALGFLYFSIVGKSKIAFLFLGLSFAFKMQAIFIAPMIIVFIIKNKLKLKDVWVFPMTFLTTLTPSIVAGAGLFDLILIYYEQFGYFYPMLSNNAISIWQLAHPLRYDMEIVNAALFVSAVSVTSLMYFVWVNKERITKTVDFIQLTYLFVAIIVYTLPRMHDRYFFLADVLSIVLFAYNKKLWFVPLVTIFVSYATYIKFLTNHYLVDYLYLSITLGIVIVLVVKDLASFWEIERNVAEKVLT